MSSPLVRKVAYDLAGAFFDNADILENGARERSARFRKECKDQHEFIAKHWPKFVKYARQVLAFQLRDPNMPEREKQAIFAALLEDRGFESDDKKAQSGLVYIN